MPVTFTDHTGAAKEGKGIDKGEGRPADPNGQQARDYLLGEVVNKPAAETGRIEPTRRATPPELLSGEQWLFRQTVESLPFTNRYASGTLAFERGDIDAAAFAAGDPPSASFAQPSCATSRKPPLLAFPKRNGRMSFGSPIPTRATLN